MNAVARYLTGLQQPNEFAAGHQTEAKIGSQRRVTWARSSKIRATGVEENGLLLLQEILSLDHRIDSA